MTREDAIILLKNINHLNHTFDPYTSEAIDMAIDALSDIQSISKALIEIGDYECCDYGRGKEFYIADKWVK